MYKVQAYTKYIVLYTYLYCSILFVLYPTYLSTYVRLNLPLFFSSSPLLSDQVASICIYIYAHVYQSRFLLPRHLLNSQICILAWQGLTR